MAKKVDRPRIVTYDVDPPGLKALARRRIEGYLCNENVGRQAIEDGLPIRALPQAAFDEYLTGFVDKSSGLNVGPFVKRINAIVAQLHADTELRTLSLRYFGSDYATRASGFDLKAIGQEAIP